MTTPNICSNEKFRVWLQKWLTEYDSDKPIDLNDISYVELGSKTIDGEELDCKLYVSTEKRIKGKSSFTDLSNEAYVLKRFRHPNIIRLIDSFQCNEFTAIVLEANPGKSVDSYIRDKKYNEKLAQKLFTQIILAVSYLHSKGFAHRFLNFFTVKVDTKTEIVKLCCFDYATEFMADRAKPRLTYIAERSSVFAAPEMSRNPSKFCGREADIWSIGMILYFAICGTLPFQLGITGMLNGTSYDHIAQNTLEFPPWVSGKARDLIRRMLVIDPKERIKLHGIANHSWFGDNKQLHSIEFEEHEREREPSDAAESKQTKAIETPPNAEPSASKKNSTKGSKVSRTKFGRRNTRVTAHASSNSTTAGLSDHTAHHLMDRYKLSRKQFSQLLSEPKQSSRTVFADKSADLLNIEMGRLLDKDH